MEAAEDFVAIGKDVNEGDKDQRTPLHYSIAYNHFQVPIKPILDPLPSLCSRSSIRPVHATFDLRTCP